MTISTIQTNVINAFKEEVLERHSGHQDIKFKNEYCSNTGLYVRRIFISAYKFRIIGDIHYMISIGPKRVFGLQWQKLETS